MDETLGCGPQKIQHEIRGRKIPSDLSCWQSFLGACSHVLRSLGLERKQEKADVD